MISITFAAPTVVSVAFAAVTAVSRASMRALVCHLYHLLILAN
jgi:hypothetical protein